MTDYVNPVLWWLIQALIGGVITLIGLVLRAHNERDQERHANMSEEVKNLREKMHEVRGLVAELKALEYLRGTKK